MIKRISIFVTILVTLAFILSIFIHLSVLTIREQQTGELLLMAHLKNEIFSLQWMHSVELEQWRETFMIKNSKEIELKETRFKAWGAGVPENEGEVFYTEGDWFIMKGFENRTFEKLPINVSCYVNQRLMYNSKTIPLCDLVRDEVPVVIRNEELSILSYLYNLSFKEVSSWNNK